MIELVTQSQRVINTRQKIIMAGKKLFEKQGFEQTTLKQIIEAAQVARRTFYKHFETKVDLLVVCSRDDGSEKVQALMDTVEQGADATQALFRYYVLLAQWFEHNALIAESIIISGIKLHDNTSHDPTRVAHDFTRLMMQYAQNQKMIREDMSPETLATQLGGAFSIAVIRWSKNPIPNVLVQETQTILKLFFEGACPQGVSDDK